MFEVARRSFLAGLASAGALAAPSAYAAETNKYVKDRLKIYGRVRGAPKNEPGIWWYTGKLWGKRHFDTAVQFFRVDGLSFNRMVLNPDGTLIQKMIEVGFWNDPITGKPADDWVNPINGLACKPKHYKSSQSFVFTTDGQAQRGSDAAANQSFTGYITDPVVMGDTLWINEDLFMKRANTATDQPDPLMNVGPYMTATSLVTYTSKTKDLDTPETQWVPSTMNFQTMGTWYPWMRMGHEPGNIMFQLVGKKLRRSDEMPLELQALINERHPGFLENPGV